MDTAEDFGQKGKTEAREKKKMNSDKNCLQHVLNSAILSPERVSESLNHTFCIIESVDMLKNVINHRSPPTHLSSGTADPIVLH